MKKRNLVLAYTVALLVFIWFLSFENNSLVTTSYNVKFKNLPAQFDGFTIVQISDLHCKSFGTDQKALVDAVKQAKPDAIALTGDLVDRRHYDEQPVLALLDQTKKIAPEYFVTGNHEWWSGRFNGLKNKLKKRGVIVLQNNYVEVRRGGKSLALVGIDDIARYVDISNYNDQPWVEDNIARRELDVAERGLPKEDFTVLLAHRPERFPIYNSYGVDLALSGHTHGGQINIPFIGALYAPDQGLFPRYSAGKYTLGKSTMIVSRGLGNSVVPQRIFDRPEIVIIKLKK